MANVNKGKKRIAILTGGGDVPGLNPAIRAVTIRALREGYEVIGLRRGWAGVIDIVRDEGLRQQQQLPAPVGGDRQPGRTHRRHVPAHLAHAAEHVSRLMRCRSTSRFSIAGRRTT